MSRDSVSHTIKIAVGLCFVCSLLVSAAAVALRPWQETNKVTLERREILKAAGLYDPAEHTSADVNALYDEHIERKLIDLATGRVAENVDAESYDQRKAAKDPQLSVEIPSDADYAGIKRREKYSFVYFVKDGQGGYKNVILPVYGKGLWSTMYGYLALGTGKDLNKVAGISFYDHGETPGLGGEIENPTWQETWQGKIAFDAEWNPEIKVIKGGVNESSPEAEHQIDALSGATITSAGVENTMKYWLGEDGFGLFLQRLRNQKREG